MIGSALSPFVTIAKFCELTGYSRRAVEGKIHRGDWLQDREFKKASDGRILMDMNGFVRWVEQGPATLAELEQLERARLARGDSRAS